MKKGIFLITLSVVLGGCFYGNKGVVVDEGASVETSTLDEIDNLNSVIILDENELIMVDIENGKSVELSTLQAEQIPPIRNLDTFKLSSSGRYVVWYSPGLGILQLDLESMIIEAMYEPTNWFNEYPYMSMDATSDTVILIDDEGRELLSFDLESREEKRLSIPHPYGTRFLVAPDHSRIVFISGYAQDISNPSYLITSADMSEQERFVSRGSVLERAVIAWLPDSSSLITLGEGDELWKYPVSNLEEPELFFSNANGNRIISIETIDDFLYIYSADQSWKILDEGGILVASVPSNIVSDLSKPKIKPINRDRILIEEEIVDGDEKFSRVWKGNWLGNKDMLYPKYSQTTVVVEPVEF